MDKRLVEMFEKFEEVGGVPSNGTMIVYGKDGPEVYEIVDGRLGERVPPVKAEGNGG